MISLQTVEAEVALQIIEKPKLSVQDDVVIYSHIIEILIHDIDVISVEEKFNVRNVQATTVSNANIWLKDIKITNLIIKDEEDIELDYSILTFENNHTSLVSIEFNRALEKFQSYEFSLFYSSERSRECTNN